MNKIFIEEPINCPCCNSVLEKVKDQLFCRNKSCSAQLNKRLEHFAKALSIKGLGPKTVEALNLSDLIEIFYLDEELVVEAIGKPLAKKLLNEIEKAKAETSLATVIESFAIPLVGKNTAKQIATQAKDIDSIDASILKKAEIGQKASENFLLWKNTEYQEIKEFLPFKFSNELPTSTSNMKKVCITGKLKTFKTKADAQGPLASRGYMLVDSVTKDTNILVDEGNDSTSSKYQKAVKYGIQIITDLNDLLKDK